MDVFLVTETCLCLLPPADSGIEIDGEEESRGPNFIQSLHRSDEASPRLRILRHS